MNVKTLKINAFTDLLDSGNPAGVVLDSPVLNDDQMKYISKALVVSETAFVLNSDLADYKTRFFSPEVEVNLCGHATIATFFTMALQGKLRKKNTVTQETKAGILPVDIIYDEKGTLDRVMMTQKKPVYKDIHFDISKIANVLNISDDDIDDSLPKQIVSTGLYCLPLCIKSFDALKKINPDFDEIKKICSSLDVGSFHLFTFETIEEDSVYHARALAPLYGINEDPVTGTSNGALCSYLIKNKIVKDKHLKCEQGDIIGRSGRVYVEIDNDLVKVGGRARFVEEREIEV